MKPKASISVIIPTYRRNGLLLKCLDSLLHQTAQDFEVLVADNACDPDLEKAVAARSGGARIRYVAEPTPGAHNARHTGARMATGNLLLFTDDDAVPDPGWVDAYARSFHEHPQMQAAGGRIQPEWETSPPQWIVDYISGRPDVPEFVIMDLAPEFRLRKDGFFYSVNMAIRKDIFFQLGGFYPDAIGDRLVGSGESGLNHELWNHELPIGYVPDAMVHHFIPAKRMTLEALIQWARNNGVSDAHLMFRAGIPGRHALYHLLLRKSVANRARGVLIKLRNKGRLDRKSIERQMWHAREQEVSTYIRRILHDPEFRRLVLHRDWLNAPP